MWLGQVINVTGTTRGLRRRSRRRLPGLVSKIEELGHVHLRRIPPGQVWKAEAGLNQLINGGVISRSVGNKVRAGERRHYDKRHAITSKSKIAVAPSGAHAIATVAVVARLQVGRKNAVRAYRGLRRNMIIKPAVFIVGQDEHRAVPGGTGHERVDERSDVLGSRLRAAAGSTKVAAHRMLIAAAQEAWINHGYRRQGAIGQIAEVLRNGHEVCPVLKGKSEHAHFATGHRRGAGVGDIHLPGNSVFLQQWKMVL